MQLQSVLAFKQDLAQSADLSALVAPTSMLESVGPAVAAPQFAVAMGNWRAARPQAALRLARKPDLTGFAIGVSPQTENDYKLAIRLYGKQRASSLPAKVRDLARMAERYPGDVELVTGVRYQPRGLTIRAGGSVGHPQITAGTLGAFVQDAKHYYALSNNHVLANSDNAVKGDEAQQPGPLDQQNGQHDVIGFLERWVPLSKATVDAAIARLNGDVVDFFEQHRYVGIGTLDPRPISDRFSVRRVIKRGRTTGVTRGTVSAFDLDGVVLDYEAPNGLVTFNNQLEFVGSPKTKPFSLGGDSGSLIIDRDTLRPYALLYGGGPDAQGIDRTLGHFIPEVLAALKIEFVP